MQEEKNCGDQDQSHIADKERSMSRDIMHIIFYFVGVAVVTFFLYHYVGQQVEVSGSSMEQTLSDGDRLILEKVTYYFEPPTRYDIIVFHPKKEEKDIYYIKRIIGLPGETVNIKDGFIYINGSRIEENYGNEIILESGQAKKNIKLEENEYFVLGDNRNNSQDSRSAKVGNVRRESIVGKVFVRIWPYQRLKN